MIQFSQVDSKYNKPDYFNILKQADLTNIWKQEIMYVYYNELCSTGREIFIKNAEHKKT